MRYKKTKVKHIVYDSDDITAPDNRELYFGMDKSKDSTLSSDVPDAQANETNTTTEKTLDEPIPPETVRRLPPVVYKIPSPYLLRISCVHLPYSSSFGSKGKLIAPSASEKPSYPIAPTNVASFPWKKTTPRPSLRLNFYASSIVLTWYMRHKPSKDYAEIVCFDLYMHEVPKIKASSCSWKKVLELKVQDLPQRCSSIELRGGNTYFFSLCAVDGDSRCGRFSVPKGITLLPSGI